MVIHGHPTAAAQELLLQTKAAFPAEIGGFFKVVFGIIGGLLAAEAKMLKSIF